MKRKYGNKNLSPAIVQTSSLNIVYYKVYRKLKDQYGTKSKVSVRAVGKGGIGGTYPPIGPQCFPPPLSGQKIKEILKFYIACPPPLSKKFSKGVFLCREILRPWSQLARSVEKCMLIMFYIVFIGSRSHFIF